MRMNGLRSEFQIRLPRHLVGRVADSSSQSLSNVAANTPHLSYPEWAKGSTRIVHILVPVGHGVVIWEGSWSGMQWELRLSAFIEE